MNRWPLFLVAAALAAPALHAQVIRTAPAGVKPARLVVTAPPQVTLDGQPDRLSPGARIRGTNGLMLLSGSVAGQPLPVVYRRDPAGLVHEVWVLTEDEYARIDDADDGSASGHQRFAELLNLVFGARK